MSEDTGGEAQVHTPPNPVEDPTDLPQLTRQSLRLRTPISRPGFIAPLSDSRRGLTSSTIPKPFRKKTAHAPVPERLEEIEQIHSEAESEEEIEISRKKVTKGASKKAPSGLKQQSKRTGKQVNVNLSQDSEENNNQEEEEVVEETDEIIEIVNNDNDISEDETVDPDDAEEELPEPGWEHNEEPDPNNHCDIQDWIHP
ncbi:hypothetical protein PtB15_17B403 [Puccinia triticina]|nr:hypothetical protein PtB15_17B403 [Puccinia triticina]